MEQVMDAGDLLLLDAILTEGTITGAARKLGEPKATVSRRLQRLEKAAGAPLFDRASRRLRPTPLGQGLAEPAAAIRVALAGAHSIADAARKEDGGRLRIASPFLFGRLVLAPFVGRLIAGRANLCVTLRFTNEMVNPVRDDVDVAIQILQPSADYLVSSKLTTVDLKLYAAPEVAASIRHAGDLRLHRAIQTSNGAADDLALHLTDGRSAWTEHLKVACTVNDPEAACYVAARCSAIAALPEFLAQCFVRTGELAPVLPEVSAGQVSIVALTPPGRLAVPLVQSFMTELRQELRDQRFGKDPAIVMSGSR